MQKHRRPNRQSRRGNHQPSNTPNHKTSPASTSTSTPSSSNPSQILTPRPPRPRPDYHPVPAHAAVTLGAAVSIVLKQDQPTGKEVQGIVAEVLTRGDHPRGVKVRLRDGRVGRVQRLVGEEEGVKGEEMVGGAESGLGRNGESSFAYSRGGMRGGQRGGFRHVRDIREDDEYLYDESSGPRDMAGYFKELEEADARLAESSGWGEDAGKRVELKSDIAICPVCEGFEGDERAVAHHVESHFGEA